MADPVTLFILVAAGERAELTRAMANATQDALGPSGHVFVREVAGEPSDAQALATQSAENAGVVVELSWTDARHQQASLRLHFANDRRWVDRTIGFARSDADAERGRTLGFAIASILPQVPSPPAEEAPPTGSVPSGAAPAESTRGASVVPAGPAGSEPRAEQHALSSVSPEPEHPRAITPAPATTRNVNFAIDVLAIGAMAAEKGDASGLGGAAAAQWFFVPHLALRLGGGVRDGDVRRAQGNLLTVFGCGGVVFHPWRAVRPGRLGASIRAEYLVVEQSLTHFGAGNTSSTVNSKPISGFGVTADATIRLAPDIQLVAGGGVEDVFAPIIVELSQHKPATTIPQLRVVAELGLRLDL
jgi:hypothetical protein